MRLRRHLLACLPLLVATGCAGFPYGTPYPYPYADAAYARGPDLRLALVDTKTSGALGGERALLPPMQLPGHATAVVGYGRVDELGFFDDRDNFAEGGLAGRGGTSGAPATTAVRTWTQRARWHNALFHDLETDESWTLLDRRGVVSRWWMMLDSDGDQLVSRAIVFLVTFDDTDGNKTLDDRDAAVAVLTSGDGRNARIVTPPEGQLAAVEFAPDGRHAFLRVRKDKNRDGKFDVDETVAPWILDLEGGGPARPLFDEATIDVADGLLAR